MRVAKITEVDRGRTFITIAVISLCLLMALDSLGVRRASAAEDGNAACAHFCAMVFGADTSAADACTGEATHGTGLCDQCGPASNGSLQLCGTQCCTALDGCHVAGTCDTSTDTCSNPLAANGTSCSDNDPLCIHGACCGAGHQVVNGGCFLIGSVGCPAGCFSIGSVIGSGNILCVNITSTVCGSNQDCPVGQACALNLACISPCNGG